jgi:signal transduction histidine kinase
VTFLRRHGLDLVIVVVALAAALEVVVRDGPDAPTTSHWFAAPAAALVALPLLLRRRWAFAAPAAVWLIAGMVSFADGRLIVFSSSLTVGGAVAAFLLGQGSDAEQRWLGLGIVLGASSIIVWNDPAHTAGDFLFTPGLFAIAWVAGYALRERSVRAEEAEAWARVAVAEERARIARELHDIVAHAVSVMVLQTGAVRHRLGSGDDAEALREVEATGRTALAEMRRLLGAMRGEDDEVEFAPSPGLGDLDGLVAAFERAGLPVRVSVAGESTPLPRALDLSAYRIIQEGLTNALKHAGASHADVVVRYGPRELGIDVRDDGRGAPAAADGLGHGLVGIRERVKLYGGSMSAGALSDGGFALVTRLPLEGASER